MPNSDNYQERNLLRIEDYAFTDGDGIRDKYLIILNRSDDSTFVVHALTTKQANGNNPQSFGCHSKGTVSYFYIPKGEIVGENGFSFDLDTFIFFGDNIIKESLKSFAKYANDNVALKDTINKSVIKNMIDCMLKSYFITPEQADYLRKTRNKL